MTTKQTDRALISIYANQGIAHFNNIESSLGQLVDQTANVAYEGQNAFDFKTKCTDNAIEFARTCTNNMHSINGVVVSAVTYIATNLGGTSISLEPPTVAITTPAINSDTSVESATDEPLRNLAIETTRLFDAVQASFDGHWADFQHLGASGGWVGPEYNEALGHIDSLTKAVLLTIDNSRTVMVNDINNQLTALGFAAA